MRWKVHGERTLYESHWLTFGLADVELPTGRRFEHEVVRAPSPSAGVVVWDPAKGVLLLWRHRFIPDSWGWEIPAGRVELGEDIEEGAAREVLEETGWAAGPLEFLCRYQCSSGVQDQIYNVFLAHGAVEQGAPQDWFESERIAWLPVDQVRQEMQAGRVKDGMSLTALCWWLAFAPDPT